MKKHLKHLTILLVTIFLTACNVVDDGTSEFRLFLEKCTYEKASKETIDGSIAVKYEQTNNGIISQKNEQIEFINDIESFYYSYEINYTNELIKDGITHKKTIIGKDENNDYHRFVKINEEDVIVKKVSFQEASTAVQNIFYRYDASFKSGGIYFAETFKINLTGVAKGMFLNEDKTLLTLKAVDSTTQTGAELHQELVINNLGLLNNVNEKLYILNTPNESVYNVECDYNIDIIKEELV
ncbi:MAG TPA: hypothetical protein VJY64_00405 [Candidatus Onthovivens sp.]|nr:hypothetical protein [Candidatus Onthovivens sp.]